MSDRLWQRLGAGSGILSVMIFLSRDLIPGQNYGTEAEEIARTCAATSAPATMDVVIPLLGIFGLLGFLFFFGSLWSALHRAEGDDGWLSAAAFGGGLAAIAIMLDGSTGALTAHSNACAGIDLQLWRTLHDMGSASFFLSFFPLAVLLGASSVVAIRFGALPGWLGWMAAIVAVALLVGATAGTIYARDDAGLPFLLFLLWTVITSIVLMRRAGQPVPPVSSASVTPPSAAS
ncbi:MAG: hypothetical protein L0332_13890 [Chloroflexi bacterium]|nr:hypothetical protein [Chloroflexota bacterium]MCI0578575.1 hypothetical protein [Chloroflexota bacterium]MCI0647334.1 hypothetical protein [Chloroflexota bacterium]MCI0727794.1 hypothetical protein [Chloroflexota bacterium]